MATFDPAAADRAQDAYCEECGAPHFAPINCYRCGQNIYMPIEYPNGHVSGISVEAAGKQLITGCPHCHASYVD